MDKRTIEKYIVTRVIDGQPHDKCQYYVLDLTHDKYAKPALMAYIEACQDEFPDLARELFTLLKGK